jgi:hypothetical protein
VDQVAKEQGVVGYLFSFNGCPPALNGPTTNTISPLDRKKCHRRNQLVEDRLIGDPRIRTVILAANWQPYLNLDHLRMVDSLRDTLVRLHSAGKVVVILADLPSPGYDTPWANAMAEYLGRAPPPAAQPQANSEIGSLARESGARVIPLFPPFCPGGRCMNTSGGHMLFLDSGHLTSAADDLLVPYLRKSGLFQAR